MIENLLAGFKFMANGNWDSQPSGIKLSVAEKVIFCVCLFFMLPIVAIIGMVKAIVLLVKLMTT